MLSRAVRRAALPLCVLGSSLAVVASTAAPAAAQDSTRADTTQKRAQADSTQQRVHTVKKHDTLWDLAKAYLGDPFQWPEIYRINRDVVEDPHWIYPGEKLRIPGSVVAVAPPPSAGDTTNAADTTGAEPQAEPAAEPAPEPDAPTTFARRDRRSAVRSDIEQAGVERAPRVRAGEYVAAPWVESRGGPRETGRIIEVNDMPGIASHGGRERLQGFDEVLVTAPAGNSPRAGTRYVSFELGPYIDDVGQVVVPTGMVEVLKDAAPGEAAVARVMQVFGDMRIAQHLVAYDTSVAMNKAQPRAVEGGRVASVRWISQQPVLPSVQSYLVLDATADQGVKPGDEFSLFRPRTGATLELHVARPELLIGKAEVIRVTPFGTTVLLTHVDQPKIEEGTKARLSAKMP